MRRQFYGGCVTDMCSNLDSDLISTKSIVFYIYNILTRMLNFKCAPLHSNFSFLKHRTWSIQDDSHIHPMNYHFVTSLPSRSHSLHISFTVERLPEFSSCHLFSVQGPCALTSVLHNLLHMLEAPMVASKR